MPNTRRTRIRRWVYEHMPAWLRTRDFEVFAAVLCITAGLPMLAGQVESRSLESQLHPVLTTVWASALVLGGICVLAGIIRSSYVTGLPSSFILWRRVEAYGLTMLAYMAYILALVAATTDWRHLFSSAMIIMAFAVTCHSREVVIQLEIVEYRLALGLDYGIE